MDIKTALQELSLDALLVDDHFPAALIGDQAIYHSRRDAALVSPCNGQQHGAIFYAEPDHLSSAIDRAGQAFLQLRHLPAPQRGELVRLLGENVRRHKRALAYLISLEAGKIRQEALGEVQEVIDICDFALGLSRQLYGLTMASERPRHRMMEQWHPLGPVGIITAFNFPMAVWSWNAALALVCGDSLVWKPSEKTPLCSLACQQMLMQAARQLPQVPDAISSVVIGDSRIGKTLCEDRRIKLVSATGSCRMGRQVAATVSSRLGRVLLELGGNNGMIIAPSADLDMALRATVFAAVGTAGQRCTTLRRLIVHHSIADTLQQKLLDAYQTIEIGDPLQGEPLLGPLIDERAYQVMRKTLQLAQQQGGRLLCGGDRIDNGFADNTYYVTPAIVRIPKDATVVEQETFAPVLYLITYHELDEAIAIHNAVPQGLSSAIFTNDLKEAEQFLSVHGSDCGIVNVNIGTSGAEIGGAFGGEKDTGGGRESGSDAWKSYMRRATNTINYGSELPLAQGISFASGNRDESP